MYVYCFYPQAVQCRPGAVNPSHPAGSIPLAAGTSTESSVVLIDHVMNATWSGACRGPSYVCMISQIFPTYSSTQQQLCFAASVAKPLLHREGTTTVAAMLYVLLLCGHLPPVCVDGLSSVTMSATLLWRVAILSTEDTNVIAILQSDRYEAISVSYHTWTVAHKYIEGTPTILELQYLQVSISTPRETDLS